MTFILSAEQEALRSTIERSFSDLCTSHYIRSVVGNQALQDRVWALLRSIGLFEYFGDSSSSMAELAMTSYEAGRALLPSSACAALYAGPFCSSRFPGYRALLERCGVAQSAAADGTSRAAIGLTLEQQSGKIVFVGDKNAAAIAVLSLFNQKDRVISVSSRGAEMVPHDSLDITTAYYAVSQGSSLAVENGESARIGFGLMTVVAAELAGTAARAVHMTLDYVLTRKQFGVPVGSFQAVQQQLAEIHLRTEAAWALVQFAASVFDDDQGQLPLAARSALRFACSAVPAVVETAIQLHGGIGFTWEYDLHLYLRRARTLASLYGLGEDDDRAILDDAAR